MQDDFLTLVCPQCNGKIPYHENDIMVTCPYCDTQSLLKDILAAKSINHLADAIESTTKPRIYQIELERAAVELAKAWNGGTGQFYMIWSAYYGLCSLTNEPELKVIEENLHALEKKYEKVQRRQDAFTWLKNKWKYITVGIFILLFGSDFLFGASDAGITLPFALAIFLLIGTGIVVFAQTFQLNSNLASGNVPEKKAISDAINSLLKKVGGSY